MDYKMRLNQAIKTLNTPDMGWSAKIDKTMKPYSLFNICY